MIFKHNVKPERVAEIVAVMRESKQSFGVLSAGEGCYCAMGCIAEAYRRAHAEEKGAWWFIDKDGCIVFRSFPPGSCIDVHQSSAILSTSPHVLEWALQDYNEFIRPIIRNAPPPE